MKVNQIKAGAVLSYINTFMGVFIGLLYVPLVLKILTIEEYGLYQIIGAITAYLGLMDLRLSTTTVRYYSQALTQQNKKREHEVTSTSLVIYLCMAGILILAGFPLMKLFVSIYSPILTTLQQREGIIMLWLGIISFALAFPTNVFSAVINSHERFVFLRMVSIISSVVRPFLSYALLMVKPYAVTLTFVQLILAIAMLLGYYLYNKKFLHVSFSVKYFDKELSLAMLKFSFFLIVVAVIDLVYWQAGKLFLGAMIGTASVAIFSFALQITQYYVTISSSLNSLMIPKVSKLVTAVEDNSGEINRLFISYSKVQGVVLGLVLSGFIVYGKAFIMLWIGDQFSLVYYLTLCLMIPFSWDLTQNFGITVITAMNKHKYRAWLYSGVVTIYIVLCYPVIKVYGAVGCAVLSGVCIFLGNGLGLSIIYSRVAHLKMRYYFYWMIRLAVPLSLSLAVGTSIQNFYPIIGWMELLLQIIIYFVFYCICIYWMYLTKKTRKTLLQKIRA
ncbi:MAG: oligosaccharide flippase family protein [Sphaerochaeta sp.]|nr:oligosaccharide flippase family protein [Sphaerochaeta sp.]